jgi:Fe-S oxidoreductase
LEAAGQLYDLVTDTCSGAPALYAGRPDLAPDWPLPPKTTVISSCPGAVTTLRRRFTGLRSLHLTSYLASRGNLALARSLTETHLFHDPCHLARHQADPTAPRLLLDQVIAEGARLELPDHGHETPCSGGGGLLPLVFPKLARRMANERIDAALETGGPESTLVTACPSCHRQLSHGGRIRVVDLTQLLARAIR